MVLKEGMYVRTEEGEISKIKWITAQRWEGLENTVEASFTLEDNENLEYPRDNFKASENIIDLIEVGDYVNGYLIEGIYERTDKHLLCNTFDDEIMIEISNDNLQSIVTKEQFASVKYEVE